MGSTALIFSHLNKDGWRRLWELAPPTRTASLARERERNQVSQERAVTGIFTAPRGGKTNRPSPWCPKQGDARCAEEERAQSTQRGTSEHLFFAPPGSFFGAHISHRWRRCRKSNSPSRGLSCPSRCCRQPAAILRQSLKHRPRPDTEPLLMSLLASKEVL